MEKELQPSLNLTTYMVDGKKLTECQMRIIGLSVKGLMRKEMAEELGKSRHTIDTHLDRIYKLLDLHSDKQLTAWACAMDLMRTAAFLGMKYWF
ncbi:MAG: hypothetical protein GC178_04295 [Flavobacteriales bacterium]|nr:hypothetical protein [Flavobacteriales bacterium]